MCAQNRPLLQEHSYYFPESEEDEDMKAGLISPGNAQDLPYFLKLGDQDKVKALLLEWKQAATAKQCKKILISSESLIHVFATELGIDTLCKAAESSGITALQCMGFLRDPEDHCLSTFKHRAKRGEIEDFRYWVANIYETMLVLEKFMGAIHHQSIKWTLRKYSKDGSKMAKAFFNDWLHLTNTLDLTAPEVNISLSLSELLVIREVAKLRPMFVQDIYLKLTALSKNEKANDPQLETLYRNIAIEELFRWQHLIEVINKYLPADEQLILKKPEKNNQITSTENIALSELQVELIINSMVKSSLPKYQLLYFIKRIVRQIRERFTVSKSVLGTVK